MPNIETCYPGLCRCADKKDCEHSTAYWAVMMDQVAGTVRTITAGLEGVKPGEHQALFDYLSGNFTVDPMTAIIGMGWRLTRPTNMVQIIDFTEDIDAELREWGADRMVGKQRYKLLRCVLEDGDNPAEWYTSMAFELHKDLLTMEPTDMEESLLVRAVNTVLDRHPEYISDQEMRPGGDFKKYAYGDKSLRLEDVNQDFSSLYQKFSDAVSSSDIEEEVSGLRENFNADFEAIFGGGGDNDE